MSESQHATRHDDIQPEGPSASEKDAMRAAHNVAISSNEKIFPIFARKLSSGDTKDYINTTNKLTSWLASEKAYYPAARTKIVELVEIALATFVQIFVRHQAVEELAEQLRKLVASVTPFLHLFSDIELQARLQRAVEETSAVAGPAPSLPSGVASASSPTITSPVNPQPSVPPIPSASTVPPMQQSPPLPREAPPVVVAGTPSAVVNANTSPQIASPSVRPVEPQPTLVSPSSPLPKETGESLSPVVAPKPQPRRLRKAELSEELKARDLDWFQSSQRVVPISADTSPGPSSSTGGENLVPSAADTSASTSTLPKKKTARMVPSRRVPRRLPLETAQEEGQTVSGSAVAPVSGLSADKSVSFEIVATVDVPMDVPMDVDDSSPPLQMTPSDVGIAQETDTAQCRSLSSDIQMVSAPATSSSLESPGNPPGPSTNAELRVSASHSALSPATSDTPRSAFTDLHAVPPHSLPLCQLKTPILPPPVAAANPPLNLDFRIPTELHLEAQEGQAKTNHRRFDGKMTVVHMIHARPFTHTHIVDMILGESLFSNVAKWVNRKVEPNHAAGGICISLGCYRLPELFKTMRSEDGAGGTRSIEELMFNSSCSWPGSNRMSLHVKRDTKNTIVTLSPPLFLTPDQCVDVSSLLTMGTNTFEVKQIGDLSAYGLVIHAHHPTRMQLGELEMVKAADERWKRFLETICVTVGPGGKVRGGEVLSTGGGTEGVVGVHS